jgi:hypothetical protein
MCRDWEIRAAGCSCLLAAERTPFACLTCQCIAKAYIPLHYTTNATQPMLASAKLCCSCCLCPCPRKWMCQWIQGCVLH